MGFEPSTYGAKTGNLNIQVLITFALSGNMYVVKAKLVNAKKKNSLKRTCQLWDSNPPPLGLKQDYHYQNIMQNMVTTEAESNLFNMVLKNVTSLNFQKRDSNQ